MQSCPFPFPLSLMRYLGGYKTATNKFNSETKIFKPIVLSCKLCVSLCGVSRVAMTPSIRAPARTMNHKQ